MSRFFKILYVFFIIICLLYPYKMFAGPIAFRHMISLLMLGACIHAGFHSDKYLFLYYLFLSFYGISCLITGYIDVFFNKILGTYLPLITMFAATYLLIRKYNGVGLLVWLIVGIGVLDATVTIGQFFNMEYVEKIFTMMNLDLEEEFAEKVGRKEQMEGYAIAGIFDSVQNGYFLSASAILTLFNKKGNIFVNLVLWVIVMAASLLAQERSGFFMAVAFSLFIMGKYIMSKGKYFAIIVAIAFIGIVAYFLYLNMDVLLLSDLRYAKGFDNDGRESFRNVAWEYLLSNPMGGFHEFMDSGARGTHNFFANAFLYGGLFGGLCVIILVIMQVLRIIPFMFKRSDSENIQWAFIWGLMYIDYTINSMVHNASVMSGSLCFFVWWGAFLGFATLEEISQKTVKAKAKVSALIPIV